jgi:hypothetical protein
MRGENGKRKMENIKLNLFGLTSIRGKNNSRKNALKTQKRFFFLVCFATSVHFYGYCFSIFACSRLTPADVFY